MGSGINTVTGIEQEAIERLCTNYTSRRVGRFLEGLLKDLTG